MTTIECQANTDIEEDADLRKYQIGRLLTFRNYSAPEVSLVPCRTFRRGDVLRVLPSNGCGMGIDVERVSDGKTDMVWPEEVQVRRKQPVLPPDTVLQDSVNRIAAAISQQICGGGPIP
jgi:hypothetical protein